MKPELEQIALGRHQSILAFAYEHDHFDAPWHFHPQAELTLIQESSGTRFIGTHVGPYEPGELVLLAGNLPHCWKNQTNTPNRCRSVVIQWNETILPQVPELDPVSELMRRARQGVYFPPEAAAPFISCMQELPQLENAVLYLSLLQLLNQLADVPSSVLSDASFVGDIPQEYSSRMARIHDFVEKHYARRIYLRELADLLSMSEQSFSRFFSKMMGRPFITFLNEYRINVAGRMLIETDWSVAQIGYACGYESLPFFHKQFSKFKQQSPLAYRKTYTRG